MTGFDESDEHQPDELPYLAERLDLLFRTVSRSADDPRLHTSSSVADALREQGIVVTPNHIRALRVGNRRNPSFRLLAGLATVFHVPLDYFANDDVAAEIQESIRALAAMRDTQVQQLLKRSHGVSSQSLSSVLALLDQIRTIEGLDHPEGTDPPDV